MIDPGLPPVLERAEENEDRYPPTFVKGSHKAGCDGSVVNRHERLTVDRTGRRGNGGVVVHRYTCNRRWDGCPAEVFVTERAFRRLAAAAVGEPSSSGEQEGRS